MKVRTDECCFKRLVLVAFQKKQRCLRENNVTDIHILLSGLCMYLYKQRVKIIMSRHLSSCLYLLTVPGYVTHNDRENLVCKHFLALEIIVSGQENVKNIQHADYCTLIVFCKAGLTVFKLSHSYLDKGIPTDTEMLVCILMAGS